MTQIMNLLYLAPDIQESILYWEEQNSLHHIAERHVRHIAQRMDWNEQRRLWRELMPPPTQNGPMTRFVVAQPRR
jgi:hypothetical protein